MKKISILGISSLFLLATLFTSCTSLQNANTPKKEPGLELQPKPLLAP